MTAEAETGAALGAPAPLAPGDRIDHYTILRAIARGGHGEVYLARDMQLGRKVALKLLRPDRVESVQRFLLEARATAALSHPNIVTIYGAGTVGGRPYVALEALEGHTLRERIESDAPGRLESLRTIRAVAEAIAAAHRHGIFHRDLKPENVVLATDGRVRVVDFGLAKVADGASAAKPAAVPAPSADAAAALGGETRQALLAVTPETVDTHGTPPYMAPEQWLRAPASGATDVWAIGVMLYELLSGTRPYQEVTVFSLAMKVTGPEPVPSVALRAELPAELAALVDRCLDKDPAKRPSASDLAAALRDVESKTRAASTGEPEEAPYRGLLPFTERQAAQFFGREPEIAAFVERLREQPVLTVAGPPGSGKSSFVAAGVIPRLLEQGRWTILRLRPAADPLAALASMLDAARDETLPPGSAAPGAARTGPSAASAIKADLGRSPARLALRLRALAAETKTRVLLFVDQLEEIETLVPDDAARATALRAIASAADDPADPVRVILTVRDDFLGRLARTPEIRAAFSRITLLDRLGPEALLETLERPLAPLGYRFEDQDLPKEMVEVVRGEPAALPLLQFAANALWERRDRERKILTRSAHGAMGGVTGALARHADGVLLGLEPEDVETVRDLLLRLVTPEGTRRRLPKSRAVAGLGPRAEAVLGRLLEARLVTMVESQHDGGEPELDLIHESLIRAWDQLARWIAATSEDRAYLQELTLAAELWHRRGRQESELWRGDALRDALRRFERRSAPDRPPEGRREAELPDLAKDFLESARRRDSARRWAAGAIFVSSALALAAVTAAFARTAEIARDRERDADAARARAEVRGADAQREGAENALARGDRIEARARLRSSLEVSDSIAARTLWWRLEGSDLAWTKQLGWVALELATSPDRRWIAAVGESKQVLLIDPDTLETLPLRLPDGPNLSVAFSPDGARLAVGSRAGAIRLLDRGRGAMRTFSGHRSAVSRVAFSADGKILASASWDHSARLWDVESGAELAVLEHAERVSGVELGPPGSGVLFTAAADGAIRAFEIEPDGGGRGGRVVARAGGAVPAFALVPRPDGQPWLIAAGGMDGVIRLFDARTGAKTRQLEGHRGAVSDIRVTPDGSRLLSVSGERVIRVWDTESGRELEGAPVEGSDLIAIAVSPSGAVASAGLDGSISLTRLHELKRVRSPEPRGALGAAGGFLGPVFTGGGANVLATGSDGNVHVFDAVTGRRTLVYAMRDLDAFAPLSLDAAGIRAATHCAQRSVCVFDLVRGIETHRFSGHEDDVTGVALSPDGRRVASVGLDRTLRVVALGGGEPLVLRGHALSIARVAFSPDGKLLASSSLDQTVKIWDAATGAERAVLAGHSGGAQAIAFSPDGAHLAAAAGDGALWWWDLRKRSGRVLGRRNEPFVDFAIAPSGDRIATAGASGTLELWDLAQGGERVIANDRRGGAGVAFSPDGASIAWSSAGGPVRVFDVATSRPRWRTVLVLPQQAAVLTHEGWVAIEEGARLVLPSSGAKPAWMRAVEERARIGAVSATGGELCFETERGEIELWDVAGDRRRIAVTGGRAEQILSLRSGCLVLETGKARVLRLLDERLDEQVIEASAIGPGEGRFLIASGAEVRSLDDSGALFGGTPARAAGATAIAEVNDAFAVGHEDGSIELGGKLIPLEDAPASPVTRIAEGPGGTLIAGFADGSVRFFSLDNGRRLHGFRLHGAIAHLAIAGDALQVVTELGAAALLDLSPLLEDRCAMLAKLWRAVPMVWEQGRPLRRPPPEEHPCAQAR